MFLFRDFFATFPEGHRADATLQITAQSMRGFKTPPHVNIAPSSRHHTACGYVVLNIPVNTTAAIDAGC